MVTAVVNISTLLMKTSITFFGLLMKTSIFQKTATKTSITHDFAANTSTIRELAAKTSTIRELAAKTSTIRELAAKTSTIRELAAKTSTFRTAALFFYGETIVIFLLTYIFEKFRMKLKKTIIFYITNAISVENSF